MSMTDYDINNMSTFDGIKVINSLHEVSVDSSKNVNKTVIVPKNRHMHSGKFA